MSLSNQSRQRVESWWVGEGEVGVYSGGFCKRRAETNDMEVITKKNERDRVQILSNGCIK